MKLSRFARAVLMAMTVALPTRAATAQVTVTAVKLQPYTDSIPGTLVAFAMVPVPAGSITMPTASGPQTVAVPAFWIAKTEITWDIYDIFAFRLDVPREERPKLGVTVRPSRPYGAPDRGFGHAGYPAIGITAPAAEAFARWISEKTGHSYRIATEAEWARAAEAAFGTTSPSPKRLAVVAWTAENAESQTHPVGQKAEDQIGAHDLLGNAGEWVTTADGGYALRGGSFRDAAAAVTITSSVRQDPTWNQTDPQVPKSRWWLSDAAFPGIRLVRVP
jgi:formylglycine-generating enzyme required for sulfatase activity